MSDEWVEIDVLCIACHEPAHANCYSEAGHKEVGISSVCEKCFDDLFKDEDENESQEPVL